MDLGKVLFLKLTYMIFTNAAPWRLVESAC